MYCPSVRAADVEIHVDDTLVSVHINPYFLRLNFSRSLLEDDASSARYDPGSGYLTITLTKEVHGQDFEDLDLLAKLLAPRPVSPPKQPIIEVLSSDEAAEEDLISRTQDLTVDDREQQEILEAAENDWQLPQSVSEQGPLKLNPQCYYGFLDMYSGYFTNVSYTENEVNELGAHVEQCRPVDRRSRRILHEDEKWDSEHYMADFAEDEYIQELIEWRHPHAEGLANPNFSDQESVMMLNLPKKEYLPTERQTHNLYLTILTILFAYAYDSRTTQHDPTPESAWTLCTLTPAFSALDPAPYSSTPDPSFAFQEEELAATFVSSYRRSLSFPLYRSFALAEKCRDDVAAFLARGKRVVFRCLLEMKDIIDHHEVYYVYSKVWLDDYCVWIQTHTSDEILSQLAAAVKATEVSKTSIGWHLDQLEAVVGEIQSQQEQTDTDIDDADSDDE
ncbi:SHQ1-domain-containing protein [Marasmius fiardii PR-910]|nr:SHQ1-domain-containing protein [Marasmius fiardii PR-910]